MTEATRDVEILSRETAYRRFFQMDILSLRHRLFHGGMSPTVEREVFIRRPAVAVLPYDPVRDQVVLVEQFRVGALLTDLPAWQLEVVAGLAEPGEEAVEVARRETMEEAGCTIGDMVEVCRYLTSSGGTNEVITFFCGRVDAPEAGGIHGLDAEHEDIRVHVLALDEAMAKVTAGQITNALAIIALQWLALNRDKIREAWR